MYLYKQWASGALQTLMGMVREKPELETLTLSDLRRFLALSKGKKRPTIEAKETY
jgi:hypothetical protein